MPETFKPVTVWTDYPLVRNTKATQVQLVDVVDTKPVSTPVIMFQDQRIAVKWNQLFTDQACKCKLAFVPEYDT